MENDGEEDAFDSLWWFDEEWRWWSEDAVDGEEEGCSDKEREKEYWQ